MSKQYLVISISDEDGTFLDWCPSQARAMTLARDMAEAGYKAIVAHQPHVLEGLTPVDENEGIFAPTTMSKPTPETVTLGTTATAAA